MTKTYDPFEHAEALGLEVHFQSIKTGHGLYIPSRRAILLRPRMKAPLERSVLAHEIQHHLLNHRKTDGVWALRQERQADHHAAHRLITPTLWHEATQWTRDPAELCNELQVSGDMLLAWTRAAA